MIKGRWFSIDIKLVYKYYIICNKQTVHQIITKKNQKASAPKQQQQKREKEREREIIQREGRKRKEKIKRRSLATTAKSKI